MLPGFGVFTVENTRLCILDTVAICGLESGVDFSKGEGLDGSGEMLITPQLESCFEH